MTVKEVMQKILADGIGDIDFCDDYDERAYVAYCGNHWSEKAEEKYARAFNLPVDEKNSRFGSNYDIVIVHCETAKDAQALADLLNAMAGYIGEEEYDELFPEPEEDEEPEHQPVEIVLRDGSVVKAKQVDLTDVYVFGTIDVLGLDEEWYPYNISNVVRIIGQRG